MDIIIYSSAFGIWLVLLVMAVLNAGLREKFFKNHMKELRAHQLSSLLFIIFIFLVTFLWINLGNFVLKDTDALFVGLLWFFLTLGFEFIAGHYFFGNSWKQLFEDYNILKGRLWVFVLISILIAPFLISKSLFG